MKKILLFLLSFPLSIFSQEPFVNWAKGIGSLGGDEGNEIAVDNSGNVYTTGYFNGTADFDPGPNTFNLITSDSDIFVSKLNASGNFVWAKRFGNSNQDIGNSVTTDLSGNVIKSLCNSFFHFNFKFIRLQPFTLLPFFIVIFDNTKKKSFFFWKRKITSKLNKMQHKT